MNGRQAVLLVWSDTEDEEEIAELRQRWESTAQATGVPLLILVRGTTSVVYTGGHERQRSTDNE